MISPLAGRVFPRPGALVTAFSPVAYDGGGSQAISPRRPEIARRVGRDVKAVHGDVHALLSAGILQKADGRVVFPYEAVHVDVLVKAA